MIIKISNSLKMVPLALSHAEELFSLVDLNRDYLHQWMGWLDKTTAVADVETFIKECDEQNEKGCGLQFVITEEDDICGILNFHRIDKMHNTGEIGYWLSQSHAGRGIMNLAVKELVRIGFRELNLNIIEMHCAEANVKSRAVPERLGFTYEATLRQREWLYSKYVNHAIYSMLASEYCE